VLHLIDYPCKKKKSNYQSYNYYKFSDYLLVYFFCDYPVSIMSYVFLN